VILCSGWLKAAGITALLPELEGAVQRGARVTVYSNRPPKKQEETENEAIDVLARLGAEHIIVERDFYLHAKIYYFEARGRYHAVLGSANITDGGLRRNEEVSVLLTGEVGDDQHHEVAAYLKHLDRRCRRAANRKINTVASAMV
jgi:phosphatidylserine/phosphatidylglycerophosphate/cardiolipin synthase-like enzyme